MQDLGMKRVMAKFIPWLLLQERREHGAAVGRTVSGPKVPTVKGTEVSLSCVQCFLYLVSSSRNVSIVHSAWLDTFWTGLACTFYSPYLKGHLRSFQ